MAITKITTDNIDLSGNTTALTFPSGGTVDGNLNAVDFLIVAGGGGLGRADQGWYGGGGGGGGFRTSISSDGNGGGQAADNALSLSTGVAYTVTVGAGGGGGVGGDTPGTTGGDSSISGSGISTITSKGGGGGGTYDPGTNKNGLDGGSGGGGGGNDGITTGGAALTSPTIMGYAGGDHPAGSGTSGAGGGGAGSAGQDGAQGSGGGTGGAGGAAKASNITGSAVYYAAGGGGRYGYSSPVNGAAGTNATGAANSGDGGTATSASGDGKAGIIILKYSSAFTATYSAGAGGSANAEVTIGNNKYIEITGGTGTVTFSGTEVIGRPGAPTEGILRDNVTTGALEFYNGSIWKKIRGTLVRACTTSTCNYPTGAGCQALYQFNDNINDTCGNYNGVSSSNITYAAGKYSNAAQLNGSSSNIFLPDNSNFDLTASQSISLWINSNNSGNAWLFQKGNPESYGLWTNGSILYFTLYNPSYSQLTTSSITLNTWYHVVLTVDSAGTGCILYLNGVVADSNTFGSAVNTNTSDVRIGSYQGGSLFWNGAIDQLRYFNTTLSSSQVTELYNEVGC